MTGLTPPHPCYLVWAAFRSATITSKGHGRIEVRTLTTSSQLNDFLDWPFLQQVFKLERSVTVQKTGITRHEVLYGITSLSAEQASPKQLLQMLRSYWGIENGLHYRRDVTLHEDETRFTRDSAAHIMSVINNIVLSLIAKTDYQFVPSADAFLPLTWRRLSTYWSNFENALPFSGLPIDMQDCSLYNKL